MSLQGFLCFYDGVCMIIAQLIAQILRLEKFSCFPSFFLLLEERRKDNKLFYLSNIFLLTKYQTNHVAAKSVAF